MDFENKLQITQRLLEESAQVAMRLSQLLPKEIVEASELIIETYQNGGKLLIFGNGGSAADAQHMACELAGRFLKERQGLPAIALTADSSILTALSNDFGFENVFSRQIETLSNRNDVILAISTSGKSKNILEAINTAKRLGVKTIGLTGESGADLANLVNILIKVPSLNTPRIQEAHITIIHIICHLVEQGLFGK
ncbi:D-sedoheptulose 7-phosphate isomerase [Candidatus Bathyarchaeota archaeon]|nr:D-sedoheptulose 7-phosphate isomerase [Candidatus Bathyarchaeota archaeon]